MQRHSFKKNRKILKLAFLLALVLIPTSYFLYKSGRVGTHSKTSLAAPEMVEGTIITLKRLQESYFMDYHNMFSSVVRKAYEFPDYITLDYTIMCLKSEIEKDKQGQQLSYCVFDNKDQKLIGWIEIREKNDKDPGQLGCWLNENYWGGGRIQEALKLITQEYFKIHPEANSYIAHVRLWNTRSYRALKKFGMKEIGYFYEGGQPTRYILEYRK